MARLFPVAGDDAHCVWFCWWVTLSTVTFVGLDRPFLPDDSFSRRPPSRIPNQQGTLIRVALWQRVDIASALFSWQHLKCALVSSQSPSGSQIGSCLPSFGLYCGIVQRSCSPSGGTISSSRLPSHGGISTLLPATPCAQGTQRVGLGSHGSLSLASELDASGSLGQGWCSAYDWQRCSVSTFSATPASPKRSMASRIIGGLPAISMVLPLQVFNMQVRRLQGFRVDVDGAPFRARTLSWQILAHEGVR